MNMLIFKHFLKKSKITYTVLLLTSHNTNYYVSMYSISVGPANSTLALNRNAMKRVKNSSILYI